MKRYYTLLFGAVLMFSVFIISPSMKAFAAPGDAAAGGAQAGATNGTCNGSGFFLGFPTWYKYLDVGPSDGDPCAVQLPKDSQGNADWSKAAPRIGLAIIDILLRLATLAALGFVIYGGFRYITSQGEPDATASARQTILNAVIGLIIALLSSGIVAFVARTLTS